MGFLDGLLGHGSEVDSGKLAQRLSGVLIEGESVSLAFKVVRDLIVFTDKRMILIDIQGLTGSKVDYLSIPYRAVTRFSVETAGTFDLDAELKIWVSGAASPIQKTLRKGDGCAGHPARDRGRGPALRKAVHRGGFHLDSGDPAKEARLEIPIEARQAVTILQRCLGGSILAVYLHGSAVAGGLRPHSDVDLLVVIDRPPTHSERKSLVAELMRISGHPDQSGPRPLELIVFHRADLSASSYSARSAFVYGEWLRAAFEAGEVPGPQSDPEFTLLLAQARQEARPLIGPEPSRLLPEVPDADIRRAIEDALPALLDTLEGDERNVLLTLARMWRTLTTGDFVPKDVAAEWAVARLPAGLAAVVDSAREAYLGTAKIDWQARRPEVRRAAAHLREQVEAAL